MLTEIGRTQFGTEGIMKNTPLAAISLAILLWPFSALATSSCDFVLQSNRDTLTRCINELRKEIDRND